MSPNPAGSAPGEPQQLSLLQGFPASAAEASGPALAADLPVARVLIESSLPHLDRPFDYSVPATLDAEARPGVRVKVKFNGQELAGFLLERTAGSDAGHPLVPLHKVVSPVPVLTPAVAELAGRIAARYAGTVSDVLRVAVPPRMAKLEKEFAPDGRLDPELACPELDGRSGEPRVASATRRRQRLGLVPQRSGVPRPPRRGGVTPGRADRPPGVRAGRLAADDRGSGGRGAASPAAAPSWWCPTTGTWTAWSLPSWNSCRPGTSPGSPRTTARRRATAVSCACSAALPGSPWARGPRPTRRCGTLGSWSAGTTATTSTLNSVPRTRTPAKSSCSAQARKEPRACSRRIHAARKRNGWSPRAGRRPWKRSGPSCGGRSRAC